MPKRAYAGSMVPLRSGGYNFNAPEVKSFDTAGTTYTADINTASITAIFTPVQGTAFANRIGTRVKAKSIHIRGFVSNTAARAHSDFEGPVNQVSVSIVLDMQPNGSNPAITDVYSSADPTGMLNLNNRDRFKVLKEKTFVFDNYNLLSAVNFSSSTVNQIRTLKIFKKCDIPVFFNSGNAGAASDISSNNILMIIRSTYPNGIGNETSASIKTRIRFIDP